MSLLQRFPFTAFQSLGVFHLHHNSRAIPRRWKTRQYPHALRVTQCVTQLLNASTRNRVQKRADTRLTLPFSPYLLNPSLRSACKETPEDTRLDSGYHESDHTMESNSSNFRGADVYANLDLDEVVARILEAEADVLDDLHGPYIVEESDGVDPLLRSTRPLLRYPQPTLVLPSNYPFRTTEAGYPIFRQIKKPKSRYRATMSTTPGFADPRVKAFVDFYTNTYSKMEVWEARVWCEKRGVATYGTHKQLVERLVERALRDAVRGWSEVVEDVGRVRMEEAPPLPPAGSDWEGTP